MHRIAFYVPKSHLDAVKSAMFAAGAGKIGQYDCCAWQTRGSGQFRPLAGSDPFLGQHDQLQQEEEYKVEMVCEDTALKSVLQALVQSHPYETPAYEAYPFITLKEL